MDQYETRFRHILCFTVTWQKANAQSPRANKSGGVEACDSLRQRYRGESTTQAVGEEGNEELPLPGPHSVLVGRRFFRTRRLARHSKLVQERLFSLSRPWLCQQCVQLVRQNACLSNAPTGPCKSFQRTNWFTNCSFRHLPSYATTKYRPSFRLQTQAMHSVSAGLPNLLMSKFLGRQSSTETTKLGVH